MLARSRAEQVLALLWLPQNTATTPAITFVTTSSYTLLVIIIITISGIGG